MTITIVLNQSQNYGVEVGPFIKLFLTSLQLNLSQKKHLISFISKTKIKINVRILLPINTIMKKSRKSTISNLD